MNIESISNAYKTVFGEDGQRTSSQELVIKDLERKCYYNNSVFVSEEGLPLCGISAALNDGKRRVFLSIKKMLNYGRSIN